MEQADATWEPVDEFKARFPNFQLEDELFVEGGRDVMIGKVYQRRGKASG
jgi:transcriptional regulator GlxA family with amidase domain